MAFNKIDGQEDSQNLAQNNDVQPAKKNKVNFPKLLDGKYFDVEKSDGTRVDAVCSTCGKITKGDAKSTGNFMEHYRKHHSSMVKEVEEYRKQKQSTVLKNPLKQTTLHEIVPLFSIQMVSQIEARIK